MEPIKLITAIVRVFSLSYLTSAIFGLLTLFTYSVSLYGNSPFQTPLAFLPLLVPVLLNLIVFLVFWICAAPLAGLILKKLPNGNGPE